MLSAMSCCTDWGCYDRIESILFPCPNTWVAAWTRETKCLNVSRLESWFALEQRARTEYILAMNDVRVHASSPSWLNTGRMVTIITHGCVHQHHHRRPDWCWWSNHGNSSRPRMRAQTWQMPVIESSRANHSLVVWLVCSLLNMARINESIFCDDESKGESGAPSAVITHNWDNINHMDRRPWLFTGVRVTNQVTTNWQANNASLLHYLGHIVMQIRYRRTLGPIVSTCQP